MLTTSAGRCWSTSSAAGYGECEAKRETQPRRTCSAHPSKSAKGGAALSLGQGQRKGGPASPPKETAPAEAGARRLRKLALLSAAPRHATGLAFLCLDRNQESIPVGVGELVPLHIGAVLERTIHLEAVVVLGAKILHVPQYDSLAVRAGLALQLHGRQLTAPKLGLSNVAGTADLNRGFLHLQFTPFEAVGFENHRCESIALLFSGGRVEGHNDPTPLFACAPLISKIPGQPILRACQIRLG